MLRLVFWVLVGTLAFLELLNLFFVNNKAALLSEDELKAYTIDGQAYSDDTLVLIPALDEENSIADAINIAKSVGKVLVINDGSTDQTKDIAYENADHLISHSKNLGLATAILNGVSFGLKNNYNHFVIFDADCQYTQKDLIAVITVLRNSKADLVLGSRLGGTIDYMPWTKKFGNYIFSKVLTYMTKIPISDGQTGLRAFSSTFASTVQFRGTFTYTQEMLFEAARNRFDVIEIPIHFKIRQYGESRLMRHPLDYAVKAWALNLQILAEYNPLKFSVYVIFGFLAIAFISNNSAYADITFTASMLVFGIVLVIFLIGLYSAIIIRKLHHYIQQPVYRTIK